MRFHCTMKQSGNFLVVYTVIPVCLHCTSLQRMQFTDSKTIYVYVFAVLPWQHTLCSRTHFAHTTGMWYTPNTHTNGLGHTLTQIWHTFLHGIWQTRWCYNRTQHTSTSVDSLTEENQVFLDFSLPRTHHSCTTSHRWSHSFLLFPHGWGRQATAKPCNIIFLKPTVYL